MSTQSPEPNNLIAESLFHVKHIFHYPTPGHANSILQPSIRATYMDLAKAKKYALRALLDEGYQPEQFLELHMRHDTQAEEPTIWPYGDGVSVWAKIVDEGIVTVEIETTHNTLGRLLDHDGDGRVKEPLFFLIQTTIDYAKDWSVGSRQTAIEGVFRTRDEAAARALTVLLGNEEGEREIKKSDFASYEENAGQDDWPFDSNIMVHAIGENGLNILVAVVESAPAV
ncbi:hypothetical protein B0J12DRAFT_43276 [Macrophomina phaseolina]|uniref:Uncharacterized protein n=1 Tax=Macrophomina phaseolina TaxID=35725 RepID=A0ABQ8GWL3_9PEZI|nr:hypothetical protein B0J12DRAFT_43276 [Macrophomina phaseolina]